MEERNNRRKEQWPLSQYVTIQIQVENKILQDNYSIASIAKLNYITSISSCITILENFIDSGQWLEDYIKLRGLRKSNVTLLF